MQLRITLAALVPLALACSGETTPETAPNPDSVPMEPVDRPPEPTADAPAAGSESISILTFSTDPGGCKVEIAVLGGQTRTLGVVPGACPARSWADASVVKAADGRTLIKTPGGALELAADGSSHAIAALPTGWSTDLIAYDTDGKLIGVGESPIEAKVGDPDEEGHQVWTWLVDGETVTYTTEGYEASVALCGEFRYESGAWKRTTTVGSGLAEGTSPPWCAYPLSGVVTAEPLGRPSEGGPGVSLPTEPAPAGGPTGEWTRSGPFASRATEWLEGQSTLTPLYFVDGAAWKAVAGFEAENSIVAIELHDTWAIACTPERSAVVDLQTGQTRWSGTFCPFRAP